VENKTACFVGSGLAALAGAAFLIRDGQMPGGPITILEQQQLPGGALDGIKEPQRGFVIRGGRDKRGVPVLTDSHSADSHSACLSLARRAGNPDGPTLEIPVSWSGLPPSFAEGYGRAGVMARGDGGDAVFETADDRRAFLPRLGDVCENHGWPVDG
jgi:hypothetical protein